MKILTIVPARLKSSRLPNKALLKIQGKTMVRLTLEKILESGLSPVVLATDSELIFDEGKKLEGVHPVMTASTHVCGTDRVLEAYNLVSEELGDFDLVINVQGDEPFISPAMLKELVQELSLRKEKAEFWTTIVDIPQKELADENVAKVVLDLNQNALIFTRSSIPCSFKHTSVYIYTPHFLKNFCSLPPSPLEKNYRLEQMRALDYGYKLNCIHLPYDSISINTEEDLEKAGIQDFEIFEMGSGL